jgi:hypothetical protein
MVAGEMSMSGAGEAGTEQLALPAQQQGLPRMTSVRSVDVLEQIEEVSGDSENESEVDTGEEGKAEQGAAASEKQRE